MVLSYLYLYHINNRIDTHLIFNIICDNYKYDVSDMVMSVGMILLTVVIIMFVLYFLLQRGVDATCMCTAMCQMKRNS